MNEMRKLMEAIEAASLREDDNEEIVHELIEIQQQMLELLGQAESLLQHTGEYNSAKSYWLAHIETALTNNHGYLGGSMTTMEDTIEALGQSDEDDGYDDDDDDYDDDDPSWDRAKA